MPQTARTSFPASSILRRWFASVVLIVLAAGALALPSTAAGPTADRPYGLKVPAGYDGRRPIPLVVLLHGYTSSGATQAAYFGLRPKPTRPGSCSPTPTAPWTGSGTGSGTPPTPAATSSTPASTTSPT